MSFTENNFVFTNEICDPLCRNSIAGSFKRFLIRNNIPVRKFHSLRHTFSTQLFKSGVELLTVSKLLGHTNLETTKVYTHVSETEKENAINKLNKIFM